MPTVVFFFFFEENLVGEKERGGAPRRPSFFQRVRAPLRVSVFIFGRHGGAPPPQKRCILSTHVAWCMGEVRVLLSTFFAALSVFCFPPLPKHSRVKILEASSGGAEGERLLVSMITTMLPVSFSETDGFDYLRGGDGNRDAVDEARSARNAVERPSTLRHPLPSSARHPSFQFCPSLFSLQSTVRSFVSFFVVGGVSVSNGPCLLWRRFTT